MTFKAKPASLSFSDLEFIHRKFKNRTLEILEKIDAAISWDPIKDRLMKSYTIGQKKIGNAAYPPLMLFKCFLIKQWYRIKSDVELECMINDRVSFKRFTGLGLLDKSPDSSTFYRFRKRITPKKLSLLMREVTFQLTEKKCRLKKGAHADPRLVRYRPKTSKKKKAKK